MNINDALERLNTGKFSFQVSDCIASHIAAQSQQIDELTAVSEQRGVDIIQRDLHIHLLEREVSNLKASLLGAFKLRTLVSQTIETAIEAKEKLRTIDGPAMRLWISGMDNRLSVFGESFRRTVEQVLNDQRPTVREYVKLVEKLTSDLYSKFRAAA